MNEDHSALVRDLSAPLASGSGWIKFLGIITIVSAALGVLGSFGLGLLVAWLPIWMGVLLVQAGGALDRAWHAGNDTDLRMALGKLRTYFVVQGVLVVVMIVLVVLAFMFGLGAAILAGIHARGF